MNPPANKPNIISNNLIYDFTNTNTVAGIGMFNSNNTKVYFNSISIGISGGNAGDYADGAILSGNGVEFRNNNVSITKSGPSTKTAIVVGPGIQSSDNNNLFVDPTDPSAHVGYFNGNHSTLAAWQQANNGSFDQNSLSIDPVFANAATGDLTPDPILASALESAGVPIVALGIPNTDFFLQNRPAFGGTAPDIGAIEFNGTVTAAAKAPITNDNISIYPNPASESFNIAISGSYHGKVSLQLYDITGRKVMSETVNKQAMALTSTLNVRSLSSGLYLVKVIQGDDVQVRKVEVR